MCHSGRYCVVARELHASGGFRLGPGGGTGPPNLAQPPKFLIGSVVHFFY